MDEVFDSKYVLFDQQVGFDDLVYFDISGWLVCLRDEEVCLLVVGESVDVGIGDYVCFVQHNHLFIVLIVL